MADPKPHLITVRSNLKGAHANEVALWEVNPDHPFDEDLGEHEVYIAGPGEHEVAPTRKVLAQISDGALKVTEGKLPDDDDDEDARPARAQARPQATPERPPERPPASPPASQPAGPGTTGNRPADTK